MEPKQAVVVISMNLDTYELSIDAPELPLDFAMSLVERAKRALENQEKIVVAQQLRQMAADQERTKSVVSRIKM